MPKKAKTENEMKKEKSVKAEKKKEKLKPEHEKNNEADEMICEERASDERDSSAIADSDTEADANQENEETVAGDEKTTDDVKTDDEDIQTKYVRLAADFQNFRRRTESEKKDIYAYANENIVRDLLNVTDNFERAIDQAKKSSDQALADGIALIYKQFKEVLEKFGTQEIPAQGELFNPNLHHAVMMDGEGTDESGKITEVFQKGYTLNGRVVRPSMVKVAQ